jgi:hypothetical protein
MGRPRVKPSGKPPSSENYAQRRLIVDFATSNRLPNIHAYREAVEGESRRRIHQHPPWGGPGRRSGERRSHDEERGSAHRAPLLRLDHPVGGHDVTHGRDLIAPAVQTVGLAGLGQRGLDEGMGGDPGRASATLGSLRGADRARRAATHPGRRYCSPMAPPSGQRVSLWYTARSIARVGCTGG